MSSNKALARRVDGILAINTDFVKTALSLPDRLESVLAEMKPDSNLVAMLLARVDGMEAMGKRIRADNSAMQALGISKLILISEFGGLLPMGKKGAGRGHKNGRGALPFCKTVVAAYRKVGQHKNKLPEYRMEVQADPDAEVSTAAFLRRVGSGPMLASKHTREMEWYTPDKYIESVRAVLGEIDLDPATNAYAQKIVKAEKFYTPKDDGLASDWTGRVFLNPPFKMPAIRQFVNKLCEHYIAGHVTAAVLLTNDNTDTQWWQRACQTASLICLCAGRISFYNSAGQWSCPTNGQTFFYYGKKSAEFKRVFGVYGNIVCNA
jgi:phage N-6-adenine-methyltransferase